MKEECKHEKEVAAEYGIVECYDCGKILFKPEEEPATEELPKAPRAKSMLEKITGKKKTEEKKGVNTTSNEQKEELTLKGMGLSCPHCNKHIEIMFRGK